MAILKNKNKKKNTRTIFFTVSIKMERQIQVKQDYVKLKQIKIT